VKLTETQLRKAYQSKLLCDEALSFSQFKAAAEATLEVIETTPVSFKWVPAPFKTQWGASMKELIVAIGKDETMLIYVDASATADAEQLLKTGLKSEDL